MEKGKEIGGFAGSLEVVRTLILQVQELGRGVGAASGPHQERKPGLLTLQLCCFITWTLDFTS